MGDYAECRKHQDSSGRLDSCQKFLNDWGGNTCSFCRCEKNYHRYVEPKFPPPVKYKTEVVYTKCHKIHEFKFQNSVDGCQEFTPSGGDGTICALCGCHKGFHRNEVTREA